MNLLKRKYIYLLLFISTFLLYANTLSYDYVYFDDNQLILNQFDQLKKLSNLPSLFTNPLFQLEGEVFYRPIMMVTYMIDTLIGNGNPFFYHLSNILLHCINCILLFNCLQLIQHRKKINIILALLFAFHPVLTQNVAWIPRGDMLLSLFSLLSFIFFIHYIRSKKIYFLSLHFISFLLALFTKETAIAIPLICMGTYLFFTKNIEINKIIYFIVMWIYGVVPWFIIRSYIVPLSETVSKLSLFNFMTESINILLVYWGKIFLPVNLSPIPIKDDTSTYYGLISLVLLIIFIYKLSFKNNRKAILGFFWFFIFMLPTIIATIIKPIYYESRLYTPIVGIFIAASPIKITQITPLTKKIIHIILIFIIILFSLKVISYSLIYKNREVFWDFAIQKSPHSGLVQYNVGINNQESGNYQKALENYKKSIKYDPENTDATNNLGLIYLNKYSNPNKAIYYFEKAIDISETPKQAYFRNLATAYFADKRYTEAREVYLYLIRDNAQEANIYYNIALTYYYTNQKEKAIKYCKKALEINPNHEKGKLFLENEAKNQIK